MRELSLSFVCVELIPPGIAGACALTFFKGRDELSGCTRVCGELRAPISMRRITLEAFGRAIPSEFSLSARSDDR